MGHVTRDTTWCEIDINTTTGAIFLQERWRYTWEVQAGQPAWTEAQRFAFHRRADNAIWAAWSNRVTMSVAGTSGYARRFRDTPVRIDLDIRRVQRDEHWNVFVTKIAPATQVTSSVQWTARRIDLDTEDFATRTFTSRGARPVTTTQTPVAHEFGHAAGNTAVLGRGDEYNATSTHSADRASIMHQGHALRARHFRTIIEELDVMIPNTSFTVHRV